MTKRADPVTTYDGAWPGWPMPPEIHKKGPWAQLNVWDHPGLRGDIKRYAASADIWIHANGTAYYLQYSAWRATVTLPGPACTCADAAGTCIHLRLVDVLRGLP